MKATYMKPAMRALGFESGELLSVSGRGISYGGIDHGENTPSSREFDSDDEEW